MHHCNHYSFEPVPIALRRICLAETSVGAGAAAFWNRRLPTRSDKVRTRDDTVAPSRRFLLFSMSALIQNEPKWLAAHPSRRDCAISSVKSHNRPRSKTLPDVGSRSGVQSGASRSAGPARDSLSLATRMMPSSSNRWYEFLSVSLLTASK